MRSMSFATVRRLAADLPGVESGTTHGSPALKIDGKLLTCLAIHKSAEPDTLAARIGFDARAQLIAAEPDIYYLTDHYVDYPVVLVRLSQIHPGALRDLLQMSWQFVAGRTKKRARARRRP